MIDLQNRRAFLRAAAAAGVAWASADFLEIEDALAWAGQQSARAGAATAAITNLTKAQADVLDAVVARIIPSVDGRPGAREAGAIYFIDRALGSFNRNQKPLYLTAIADLERRAATKVAGRGFAALPPAQQDEVLRDVEKTPFFQAIRFDAIVGTFALPSWGGNRDYAGWHMIGFEHQPRFQAPFGSYDADVNRRG